jgi:hypothetical protein
MTQPAPIPPTPAPPGDPAPAPTDPSPTPTPAPPGDQPLGPAGQKALAAEREARKALEKQLADLAPLKDLAAALSGSQPTPGKSAEDLLNERFAKYETDLTSERTARWRAEVAAEKSLTAQQAARLQGATRDELAADADALVALFPAAGPRTPAPDPSQGARGGQPSGDIDARIAEAQKSGDWQTAIALKRQKQFQ